MKLSMTLLRALTTMTVALTVGMTAMAQDLPDEAAVAQAQMQPEGNAAPAPLNETPAASEAPAPATAAASASPPITRAAKRIPPPAAVAPTAAAGSTPNPLTSPSGETAQAMRVVVGLTTLAILPALLVCLTSFLRIIIVLSMLRHAVGMPETPPNTVLIGLALFLTLFTMSPVLEKLNQDAVQPFMGGKMSVQAAYEKGSGPLREFMVRQTREQDLGLMVELSKAKRPESMSDISNVQLVPAFMLSELRAAFQIGFVIFLPFLLIDLIVSSVLMALGMMMMPPTTVALPLKILMFILVDGWSIVLRALVGSFH
ncbi:MAG: flagellar biosynthetic protein FliP [Ramlibacter sp.]|nr:flagellar biosynthetic protein FliP [Ramlibacter sp.]